MLHVVVLIKSVAILCRRKKDSLFVVVKELFQSEMTEEDRKAAMNEIQVLSMLRHPNIIAYFDSFTVDPDKELHGTDKTMLGSSIGSLMIVMEYAEGESHCCFILNSYSGLIE